MITQRRMKDLGTFKTGLTYSPNDLTSIGEGVLVLRSSNIQEGKIVFDDNVYVNCALSDEQKVKKDDILICSRNGSAKLVGKSSIIPDNIDASWGAFMMLFRSYGSNSRYLNYLFSSQIENYKGMFSTSTINQLTNAMLGNMFVAYEDDTSKQQAIADYLDKKTAEIDEQITLLEHKQKAYQKLKASLINQVVTRGLNPNAPLRDSEIDWIGEIPAHWEVKRFKAFAKTIKGKSLDALSEPYEESLKVLSVECLRQDEAQFYDYVFESDKNQICTPSDIVVIWDGAGVGEFLKAKDGVLSSTIAKIKFTTNEVLPSFFWHWRYKIEYRLKSIPTGMGIPHLNPNLLNNFKIAIPPIEEQQAIADYLDEKTAEIDEQISNIDKKINTYKRLKQSLIDEVVTGKRKI